MIKMSKNKNDDDCLIFNRQQLQLYQKQLDNTFKKIVIV